MSDVAELIAQRPPLESALALLRVANLPVSDLTGEHLENFFYRGPREAPVGIVGVELFGRSALLRSLAVAPNSRSGGIGRSLVHHAERYAKSRGAGSLFLLTTTAEAYFIRRGYTRFSREAAPTEIRATTQFSSLCPATSVLMGRAL